MAKAGLLLLIAVLLGPIGCARGLVTQPRSVPADVAASLGQVGLATARFRPTADVHTPPGRLDAIAKGAAKGALIVLAAGGASGNGYAAIAAIGLSPLGAAIGALVGLGMAEPVDNVAALEATIRRALAGADAQAEMRDAMLDVVGRRAGPPLIPLLIPGPAALDDRPSYQELVQSGIDTVLELTVTVVRLAPNPPLRSLEHRPNPNLTLELTARARLVRVADGVERYTRSFRANDGDFAFARWADADARLLRDSRGHAFRSLAARVAAELLGPLGPDPDEGPPAEETAPEDAVPPLGHLSSTSQ